MNALLKYITKQNIHHNQKMAMAREILARGTKLNTLTRKQVPLTEVDKQALRGFVEGAMATKEEKAYAQGNIAYRKSKNKSIRNAKYYNPRTIRFNGMSYNDVVEYYDDVFANLPQEKKKRGRPSTRK